MIMQNDQFIYFIINVWVHRLKIGLMGSVFQKLGMSQVITWIRDVPSLSWLRCALAHLYTTSPTRFARRGIILYICNLSMILFELWLFIFDNYFLVYLVGGSSSTEGNVFAINPTTGVNGPVCDDGWDLDNVSSDFKPGLHGRQKPFQGCFTTRLW